METSAKDVQRCVDVYPIAVSLTNAPKTRQKYLFRKSHNGGTHNMSEMSEETKLAVQKAFETLVSHKEELPAEFIDMFAKAGVSETPTVDVEELAKDNSVSPELLAILKDMSGKVTQLTTHNKELLEKNAEIERNALVKSYDAVADEMELLPIQKSDLSQLLFTLRTEHGEAITTQVQDLLAKCHEVIKSGEAIPTDTDGADAGDETAQGSGEAFRDAVVAEMAKDTSDKSKASKAVDAMKIVKARDPKGYEDYNEKVKVGALTNLI